jgi:hypothetical protein
VSAIDSNGRTIWIADAHRDDGKRIRCARGRSFPRMTPTRMFAASALSSFHRSSIRTGSQESDLDKRSELLIGDSLRAHSNHENVSERVRRKSNRFLPEDTAMIPRVGLRCRRIRTLCSEAAGQAITMTFVRDEFLDRQTAENV